MKCCKCGTQITDDSVFCPHCGSKQTAGSSTSNNSWFTPANNLDDSPIVERSHTQPTEVPVAASSFIKPVKGIKEPSTAKVHAPATPVTHTDPVKPKPVSPSKPVEPAKPIGKPATHDSHKADSSIASKMWSKYAIAAIAVVAVIIFIFAAVGSNNKQPSYGGEQIGSTQKDGNYYTVEQARQIISEEGYKLGDDIETKSEDGDFYYKVNLAKEEFNFLTISGYVEFTAEYDAGRWITHLNPQVNYDWKLSGSWFAETESYDVYMDIKSYTGSNLRLVLEAQYDSTEGGKGSYNEQDQMVTLKFVDDDYREENGIYDVYLYCEVSGGYPMFQLRIDKDTMTIWQLYDSYKAEFVPD